MPATERERVVEKIKFSGLTVRRANYADPYPDDPPSKPFPKMRIEMELGVLEATVPAARIQISLRMLAGDDKPVEVLSVTVEGFFEDINGDAASFQKFLANNRAVPILFPFVRERVHSLTTQTRGNAILLPLIDSLSAFRESPLSDPGAGQ